MAGGGVDEPAAVAAAGGVEGGGVDEPAAATRVGGVDELAAATRAGDNSKEGDAAEGDGAAAPASPPPDAGRCDHATLLE